ncbi:hypothetical protein [Rhizobium sp.]|uniref:hypothetical protein n=1 Tax=Rhizobium sp. TaxID=391 RepID=UPI002F1386D7
MLRIENSKTGIANISRAGDANPSPKPFGRRFPGDDLKAAFKPRAAFTTDFIPLPDAN